MGGRVLLKTASKVLVQARIKETSKRKLTQLAKASGDRKLAAYVALVLEDHAKNVDLKTVRAISRAWRDVKEDRTTVVRRKDGPK